MALVEAVGHVEKTIKVRALGHVIDEGELVCSRVADEALNLGVVVKVLDFTKVGGNFQNFHVIGFGEKEESVFAVARGIEIGVVV